jgi:hypothetical protein
MKLFKVTTTVPEFSAHRNVALCWFVDKRLTPEKRPYADLIEDYKGADDRRCYPESAIDELFSEREAADFLAWLKENRGENDETTKVTEAKLPIHFNEIGLSGVAYGGPVDCLCLRGLEDPISSPIGFTACGYFDLRAHEPIDKDSPCPLAVPQRPLHGKRGKYLSLALKPKEQARKPGPGGARPSLKDKLEDEIPF